MPSGTVTWYDHNLGRGRIEDSSGKYAVVADDMAPDAQVEGARVHFDIEPGDKIDRAVNVTLRTGTRNDPNQRRFGDSD